MKQTLRSFLVVFLGFVLPIGFGCGGGDSDDDGGDAESTVAEVTENADGSSTGEDTSAPENSSVATPNAGAFANPERRILAIGDSNTAGVGVGQPWPDKLELLLGSEVYRRGVAGEQTAHGVGRINGLMQSLQPTHVCILYGTNDAASKLDPNQALVNIGQMIDIAKSFGADVILGTLPPILFEDAEIKAIRLVIDDGINGVANGRGAKVAHISEALGEAVGLMQSDGLHPNDAGHTIMARQFANQF